MERSSTNQTVPQLLSVSIENIKGQITTLKQNIGDQNANDHEELDALLALLGRVETQIIQLKPNLEPNSLKTFFASYLIRILQKLSIHLSKLSPSVELSPPLLNSLSNKKQPDCRADIDSAFRSYLENFEIIDKSAAWICSFLAMATFIALAIIFKLPADSVLIVGIFASVILGITGGLIAKKCMPDLKIDVAMKLILDLENVLTYERLPTLTANRISKGLEWGENRSRLLSNRFKVDKTKAGLRLFVLAKNEEVMNKACKYLIENKHGFLVAANIGTAGGYVIGIFSSCKEFQQELETLKIPFMTTSPAENIGFTEFSAFTQLQSAYSDPEEYYQTQLTLHASGEFRPGDIEFFAEKISLGDNGGTASAIIKQSATAYSNSPRHIRNKAECVVEEKSKDLIRPGVV